MLKRLGSLLVLIPLLLVTVYSAQAQGNLLQNSDMEGGFSSRDGVTGVPLTWAFRKLAGNVDADRQAFAPYARSAPTFWAMRGSYSSYLAVGYQTVNVTRGAAYRLSAFAFIWSCNDNVYSCIPADAPRFSQKESGMRVRIGIDPNAGDDPNAPEIAWGPWVQPFDAYQGLTIDAVATGAQVTVFLMADSGQAMVWNETYWDDVTLVQVPGVGQTGAVTTTTGTNTTAPVVVAPPPVAAPNTFAAFVDRQQARADGSVVHLIREGDTFDAIAYAYSALGVTRDMILQANNWTFPPNFIIPGQEIRILPPGSVDPATGQLLSLTGSGSAAASTTTQPTAISDLSGEAVPVAPTVDPAQAVAVAPTAQAAVAVVPTAQPAQAVASTAPGQLRRLTAAEISALIPVESIAPFLP